MSENTWIYFVKVNGHTFQTDSLKAFARIALFARWYFKTHQSGGGMDCSGHRLRGSLGFIRRPVQKSSVVRVTPPSFSGDRGESVFQKIRA